MSTATDITSSNVLPARLPKGFVLERYTVDGWLRDGGMAAIYRARRGPNQQRVALKLQLPSTAHDPAICERFDREAEVMCRANGSPHVAELFDSGVLEDGRRYFVLEWVDGENLEELLDFLRNQDQRLPLVRACKIARDIARGLAELHEHGVLHLDLKPANVMVAQADDGGDEIKLVDFGIAADLHEEDVTSDGEHVVMGTSGYMSPEQVQGEPSSPAFDVYALGVLLFEALSGSSVPPDGWKPEMLPPLESLRKGVPERLAALVRACMDFDPARRPASAQAVAATLVKIIRTLQAEGQPPRRPSSGSIAVRTGGTEIVPQSIVPTMPVTAANRQPPRTGATEVVLTHHEVMLSSDVGPGLAADVLEEGRRRLERQVEEEPRSRPQLRWAIVGGALLFVGLVVVGVWAGRGDGQGDAPVVTARAPGVEATMASPSARALEPEEERGIVEPSARADAPKQVVVKHDDAVVDEAAAVVNEAATVVNEAGTVVNEAGTVATTDDEDDQLAPEPEAAREPSPASGARKREGPSAEACKSVRADAVEAKQSRSWRTVLKETRASTCWTNSRERLERKQLRVQAHAELGEFGKCAKEGGKAKDEAIAARVKFCKKQLGGA